MRKSEKTIYYNNNLKNVKYEKITYFINNTYVTLCNHAKCNGTILLHGWPASEEQCERLE